VGTRERAVERGQRTADRLISALAAEARAARRDRNLSLRAVGAALGVSSATVWRFEHARAPNATIAFVAQLFAVLGLDLSARGYPGPTPLRDSAQRDAVALFLGQLHPSLAYGTEVPLPEAGDQRRWDVLVRGPDWRFGVEVETGPSDAQALAGRLTLKLRDADVDGMLLVVPATRRVDAFLETARPILEPIFPAAGVDVLEALRRGARPSGNGIVVLRRSGQAAGDSRFVAGNKRRIPTP